MNPWIHIIMLLTLGAASGQAAAATLTVDGSGGADYTTIQDAVDAASDGDVIEVAPGTYVDDDGDGAVVLTGYTIALDVTIKAASAGVRIEGADTAMGIACWGGDTTIEGLDFTNCVATESWGGGGVMARNNGDSITITSCTFSDCTDLQSFGKGGAICLYSTMSSSPITFAVSDTTFGDCASSAYGGAVYTRNAEGSMSNCTFANCQAAHGGGLEIRAGKVTIDTCVFDGCIASVGGAIRVYGSSLIAEIVGSSFTENDASWGAAVFVQSGELDMVSCDVDDNVSSRSGALHVESGTVTDVSYSYFSRNEATESGYDTWHAITGDADADLTLTNTTFCDHPSTGEIEIAYVDGGGNELGNWCCPGDVDEDGDVDVADIALFLSAYGSTLITADDRQDVARDGDADVTDLMGLLENWGVCGG